MLRKKLHNYAYLLEPSALSLSVCLIVAGLTWVGAYSDYIHRLFHLSNKNFQQYSVWQHISKSYESIVGSSTANTITLWAFWLTVGIIVYLVVYFFINNIHNLEEAIEERNYIMPKGSNRNHQIVTFLEHTAVRLVILVIFIVFARQSAEYVLSRSSSNTSTLSHFTLFITQLILLHIGIVLLRLLALRARIFSSS